MISNYRLKYLAALYKVITIISTFSSSDECIFKKCVISYIRMILKWDITHNKCSYFWYFNYISMASLLYL